MFTFKRRHKVVSLLVNEDLCTGCGECAVRCKRSVFKLYEDKNKIYAIATHIENCKGCGKCMLRCPAQAIDLVIE